ncbi:hypothetical protein IV203_011777 [Nitzschia inconspicua]|uniref:Sulfotransferase domain-containing protein n=1 Tax=Nitzschia inconspicua TaxID=303405 RepID=A0A9K3PJ56_9STRA|nr:hypothetical protein IV203_011777 [Nitzschia inconspicua]
MTNNGGTTTTRRQRQRQPPSLIRLSLKRCFAARSVLALLLLSYIISHVTVIQELSSIDASGKSPPLLSSSTTLMMRTNPKVPQKQPQQQSAVRMKQKTSSVTNKKEGDSTRQSPPNNRSLPFISYDIPFDELRSAMDAGNDTVAQHLLDFGIIGFPKCGTTTMMQWLGMHNEIVAIQHEIMALQKHHPARIVNFVMKELPPGRFLRGYKSPNDVEDQRALNKLAQHYPHTKLIVGLRHPVLWYESFYNHRIQNGFNMPPMTEMNANCIGGYYGVCIGRAGYHGTLVRMGKTPLGYDNSTDANKKAEERMAERNLFSPKERRSLRNDLPVRTISPNPVFLYDTSQLKMPSTSGVDVVQQQDNYNQFVQTLKTYLGVSQDFPPMIQSKPGKKDLNATEQARRDARKVDICDEVYQEHRKWLLESGKRTKEWILDYFVKSPDVTVGNLHHFREILDMYSVDPCLQRNRNKTD